MFNQRLVCRSTLCPMTSEQESEDMTPASASTDEQPPFSSPTETAEELKRRGNELFATRQYDEAIELYNKAIAIDSENAVLYSNRSACYASKKQWQKALEDAKISISKDPNFIKAYHRLAAAQR